MTSQMTEAGLVLTSGTDSRPSAVDSLTYLALMAPLSTLPPCWKMQRQRDGTVSELVEVNLFRHFRDKPHDFCQLGITVDMQCIQSP